MQSFPDKPMLHPPPLDGEDSLTSPPYIHIYTRGISACLKE